MTRRQTAQKQAVLAAVRAAHPAHPTAADIFALVRPTLPTLSFGTVYRVLHGLAEDGAILEVLHAGGPMRYDANTSPHHHVICRACGVVGDVGMDDAALMGRSQVETTFEIHSYRIEFVGLCPDCRGQGEDSKTPC